MKKFLSSLPIIILFLSLTIVPLCYGQWWLALTFAVFGALFGAIEAVADKVTGNTVSQHFWAFKDKNKKGAFVIIAFMILAWGMLILHFLWH